MRDQNFEIWQAGSLTDDYAGRGELYAGEQRFLDDYAAELASARLLDIGVGGGRTTPRFATAVREYIGVDYAESMVEAVRRRFAGKLANARFERADARDLADFADASLDAVIFSFNGVDTLAPAERQQFLLEARRVLKATGLLAFSSHNLAALGQVFRFKRGRSLAALIENTRRKFIQMTRNPPLAQLMARDWATVYDGTHGKLLCHYYIRPAAQVAALKELGFTDIRVIDTMTGEEIEADSERAACVRWPYFFCRAPVDS